MNLSNVKYYILVVVGKRAKSWTIGTSCRSSEGARAEIPGAIAEAIGM